MMSTRSISQFQKPFRRINLNQLLDLIDFHHDITRHRNQSVAAGFVIAALAASVSFLEDQSPFQTDPHATGPYYERIDPEPGRPWNRYRLDYIPFKAALTSGHWASPTRAVGNGPDFFALHLLRARTSMPGGTAIPIWLPWTLVLFWATLGLFAGLRLLGGDVSTQRHDDPHQGHQEHKVH